MTDPRNLLLLPLAQMHLIPFVTFSKWRWKRQLIQLVKFRKCQQLMAERQMVSEILFPQNQNSISSSTTKMRPSALLIQWRSVTKSVQIMHNDDGEEWQLANVMCLCVCLRPIACHCGHHSTHWQMKITRLMASIDRIYLSKYHIDNVRLEYPSIFWIWAAIDEQCWTHRPAIKHFRRHDSSR